VGARAERRSELERCGLWVQRLRQNLHDRSVVSVLIRRESHESGEPEGILRNASTAGVELCLGKIGLCGKSIAEEPLDAQEIVVAGAGISGLCCAYELNAQRP